MNFSRRGFLRVAGTSSIGATIPSTLVERSAIAEGSTRPKFRVLSLDGGGARGYLSIKILANIEQFIDGVTQTKIPLGQRFDFIVGTSIGGIIALGLGSGRSAAEILQFYEQLVPKIFAPKEQRAWYSQYNSPKYKSEILRSAIERFFGSATLEAVKTDVCITSVALSSGAPRFYKSNYQHVNMARLDEKLSDIALATSAAPTYFASHKNLKHSDHLVDGGICANNPSVVALIDALRFEKPSMRGAAAPEDLLDIVLVSVGTGEQPSMPYDVRSLADGGLLQWAQHISEVMFESQSWLAHYQTLILLGENYLRINPVLKFAMAMDDISKLSELKNIADIGGQETRFIRKHLL